MTETTPQSQSPPVRVAVVDDHPMVLAGVASWLADTGAGRVDLVCAVQTWSELLFHPEFPADVVVLDLDLRDGIPAPTKISLLRTAGVAVVVMTAFGDSTNVAQCLAAGAQAFVDKSRGATDLTQAILTAAGDDPPLTPNEAAAIVQHEATRQVPALSGQERHALMLYASGLPLKSVARRMGVTFETAKCYVDRVREKYARAGRDARTKIELRERAVEDGLLSGAASPGLGLPT
jgi:DNA-binding NarL/FixJ family response regulator